MHFVFRGRCPNKESGSKAIKCPNVNKREPPKASPKKRSPSPSTHSSSIPTPKRKPPSPTHPQKPIVMDLASTYSVEKPKPGAKNVRKSATQKYTLIVEPCDSNTKKPQEKENTSKRKSPMDAKTSSNINRSSSSSLSKKSSSSTKQGMSSKSSCSCSEVSKKASKPVENKVVKKSSSESISKKFSPTSCKNRSSVGYSKVNQSASEDSNASWYSSHSSKVSTLATCLSRVSVPNVSKAPALTAEVPSKSKEVEDPKPDLNKAFIDLFPRKDNRVGDTEQSKIITVTKWRSEETVGVYGIDITNKRPSPTDRYPKRYCPCDDDHPLLARFGIHQCKLKRDVGASGNVLK